MYKRILVPLDGSSFGEHALPLALGLARHAGVPLHVVHVYSPATYYCAEDFILTSEIDSRIRASESEYLTRKARDLAGMTDQAVTSAMPEGPVAEALAREARTANADLIVMTTHGRGALSRFWLGSVADQLIRQAPAPVLLVRPAEETPNLGKASELRHVLIALDGEALAVEAIEPAVALGSPFAARYTLLRVLPPLSEFSVAFPDGTVAVTGQRLLEELETLDKKMETEAHADLEATAERLRARGLSVATAVTRHGQAAPGILDYAKSHAVDAIALATHGRHGLPRLVLGSVADKVLRAAPVPVLVYRPEPKPNAPAFASNRFEAAPTAAEDDADVHPGCYHGH